MPTRARTILVAAGCVAAIGALTAVAVAVTGAASEEQQAAVRAAAEARAERRVVPGDVDGDGRTDLVVYRPSTATFWVDQSSGEDLVAPLGDPGDLPTAGDFDGDGRADLVAVHTEAGTDPGVWRIRTSADGSSRTVSFGLIGDQPVPGDYDGDGLDDPAVFRVVPDGGSDGTGDDGGEGGSGGGTGTWFFLRSSDGELGAIEFGLAGDLVVPGDYDGDGTTDPAVQRGDTRWIRRSTDQATIAERFGQEGDLPVALDLEGDGRTDLAVVRVEGEELAWYVAGSGTGQIQRIVFGRSGEPLQQRLVGDFGGDGSVVPAVFDPSVPAFWLWDGTGTEVVGWGTEGDLALPLGVQPLAWTPVGSEPAGDDAPAPG